MAEHGCYQIQYTETHGHRPYWCKGVLHQASAKDCPSADAWSDLGSESE
jgi:hypothetical protein